MKKNILILASFLIIFSLSACDFAKSDEDIEKQNMENLINCMQKEDREAIKALFAPNIIEDIENFDDSIDEMLSYYNGDYVSYDGSGPMTLNDKHEGRTTKYHDMSHDITTMDNIYRIAIRWYIIDTGDINNVGIWSFYIIKFDDDPNQQYSYWGDGLWSNGINIV